MQRAAIAILLVAHTAAADDFYARLRDDAGPVPGLPGFARVVTPNPRNCGKLAVTFVHAKAPIDPEDQLLGAMLALEPPTGLDFSGPMVGPSKVKIRRWLDELSRTSDAAIHHYQRRLVTDNVPGKVVDLARIVQIQLQHASGVARLELPSDLTGEAGEFFCKSVITIVEADVTEAEQHTRECAKLAKGISPGWWNSVCK